MKNKKNLVIAILVGVIVVMSMTVIVLSVALGNADNQKCKHENTETAHHWWKRNDCVYCNEEYTYCIDCDERIETLTYEEEINHIFDTNADRCLCNTVEKVTEEIGTPSNPMDDLMAELNEAYENYNYPKISEILQRIVEIQDGNHCVISTMIFIGSVSNCTTTFDVNDDTWSARDIYTNSFAQRFKYSDIENGNVRVAIEKATKMPSESLKDCYVTIALNHETNGYEFFLETIE